MRAKTAQVTSTGLKTSTSLLALVGCALASSAFATPTGPDRSAGSGELAARAAAIAGYVRQVAPEAGSSDLTPVTVAQWRNYR